MPTLRLEHLKKIYDNNVEAVKDFNINIKDGEFIVIVGLSGCGKSTTLRMIAGLEEITYGHAYLGEKEITNLASKDRDMAMVFQNYALYAHMTIYQNMAFSLTLRKIKRPLLDKEGNPVKKIDKQAIKDKTLEADYLTKKYEEIENKESSDAIDLKNSINKLKEEIETLKTTPVQIYYETSVPKEEIHEKVMHAAKILGLEKELNKKPKQLSGGQRQRVALGRAIVRNPQVFLFDEPLSNLDAKLRVEMRRELKLLHQKLKTTMIYVTHDQIEALTLADRIVVMSDAEVQQIGTPLEVYNDPNNVFVASFIGNPPMNFINGRIDENYNFIQRVGTEIGRNEKDEPIYEYHDGEIKFALNGKSKEIIVRNNYANKDVILGVRPEHFVQNGSLNTKIELVEHLGSATLFHVLAGGMRLKVKFHGWLDYEENKELNVDFNQDLIYFFDAATQNRIR